MTTDTIKAVHILLKNDPEIPAYISLIKGEDSSQCLMVGKTYELESLLAAGILNLLSTVGDEAVKCGLPKEDAVNEFLDQFIRVLRKIVEEELLKEEDDDE